MGMTIDEAENYLIALKHCETCEATDTNICKSCPHHRKGSSAKCYDAIDFAINTMRRYKKIERILGGQGMPEWSYSKFKAIASIVRGGHDGNDNIASETRNP